MRKNFEVLVSEEAKVFIKSLEPRIQKKVAYNIQKARQVNDPRILKKLNELIWEFRTRSGNTQIRLLAFWDTTENSLIICSHGFIKKTQKTPKSEINKAIGFRKSYLKNKK